MPVALQFVAVKTPLSSTCPINPPTLSPVEDTLALEEQLLTVVVPWMVPAKAPTLSLVELTEPEMLTFSTLPFLLY